LNKFGSVSVQKTQAMKVFRYLTAGIVFAMFSLTGRASDNTLPSIDTVLAQVVAHAQQESDNDRSFEQLYGYSRQKTTEFRNGDGDVKKRDAKTSVHQPNPAAVIPSASATTSETVKRDDGVSETHSNVRGKQFKRNDFLLNQDLIRRFQFQLVAQESIDGRPAYVIEFAPLKKDLPERNIKDRFINKAAGRIWVDATDYALVKADLHLSHPVDVAFGLVGSVWKFNYSFLRSRTDEGFWFTRDVAWHLEGREVVVNRTVDYHEQVSDLHKVSSVAASN